MSEAQPDQPLAGQVAIVTGGGKGLGRAFSLHLAELGAAVVVNNRNRQVDENGLGPADHVVAEIQAAGGRAVAHHGDVADPATAASLVEDATRHFGRLDICVTSAAINPLEMLHKSSPETFRHVMDVNVTGTALVVAAASAAMRPAGHGRIIVVASGAGLHGELAAAAYAASKGAVIALARTAAFEGAPKGVLTNVLLPYALTQMTTDGIAPEQAEHLRPELVAPVIGALADPACVLNGQVVVAAGSAVRAVDVVEHATVAHPPGRLDPRDLEDLLDRSREGEPHTYSSAQEAFQSLLADLA
ncbi:MAG: SDR family NAD(P)-dependent oxidoreductase [Aeromicrobium sp.]|uniref:SDR family NAD(P)-dependent oxidoreductase n=1 Tax=Aeromicrobium sp. TaxID=1871063 RepID=UPI0025C7005B|nr:SDR family NAD(P)-dependent oxidoreductase [Aeromicrobium sp.]MCK5892361.1 SDR family NAD(P)-dependent oxidoreductase [Aeromicrobium sp.]MDF1706035.1 SDR family NAD(P)-dependent oxidoreductase [Aeromicrobium sp.]